jgi:hypothetical protein
MGGTGVPLLLAEPLPVEPEQAQSCSSSQLKPSPQSASV